MKKLIQVDPSRSMNLGNTSKFMWIINKVFQTKKENIVTTFFISVPEF